VPWVGKTNAVAEVWERGEVSVNRISKSGEENTPKEKASGSYVKKGSLKKSGKKKIPESNGKKLTGEKTWGTP